MESRKSNKIREIVRLQQILKKWRKLANNKKNNYHNNGNMNGSKSIKFLKRTLSLSDNNSSGVREAPAVPKGYLAVCVGEELKRYIIPTHYLGHEVFHILLREAEEEFGFEQAGVLQIPCEVAVFESIVKILEDKKDNCKLYMFNNVNDKPSGYCSSECPTPTPTHHHHHPQSPMCR